MKDMASNNQMPTAAGMGASVGNGLRSSYSPLHLSSDPLSSSLLSSSSPKSLPNVIGRHGSQSPRPYNHHSEQNNPIIESIQSTFNDIRQNIKSRDILPNNQNIATFLSGTLAFYTTAFSSQYIQYKFLKMSTGTRPAILPITVGAMTVALGSWMGHLAGVGTSGAWSTIRDSWNRHHVMGVVNKLPEIGGRAMSSVEEMTRPMMKVFVDGDNLSRGEKRERKEAWMHAARICILGLLTYKTIFRSHYSSIAPSSYTARGSFARIGIPAPPNFNYATRSQRAKIESIGKWWGCHTCGSRMIFSNLKKSMPKFHGDHIPPVSVAKQMNEQWHRKPFGWKVSQKFYSQCRDCSNKQGGLLSKAINEGHKNLHRVGGGEESYFHGRRIRIGHLTGGAVAVLSVENGDGNKDELVKASREKVRSFQSWIEDMGCGLKERVESVWRDLR